MHPLSGSAFGVKLEILGELNDNDKREAQELRKLVDAMLAVSQSLQSVSVTIVVKENA